MNAMNQAISNIGIVPVIKLTNPERDAAPLAENKETILSFTQDTAKSVKET